MEISIFDNNPVHANMYILEHGDRAIIIDPSIEECGLTNCSIDFIILTHEHYDHISAVNYWKDKTNAKVIASANCQKRLKTQLGIFLGSIKNSVNCKQ